MVDFASTKKSALSPIMKDQPTNEPKNLLIVDDVPSFCQDLASMLQKKGYACTICTDPNQAGAILASKPFHLVICTLVMKKMGGFDLVREIRGDGLALPIMLITAHGSPESAIEAQRLGVNDYLYQPVAPRELCARVAKLLAQATAEAEGQPAFKLDKLVSLDSAMKSIFDMAKTIAQSNSRVLILGETGTGKQLIAQAIHSLSSRKNEPFVDINCAAIPANLLESEFFGHERGSFTGAVDRRVGRFEEAKGGTIFLDEIGEVELSLQAKLLRVLENGDFNRVGGSTTIHSRARVIAATNRNLRTASQQGLFRADLFYRLHVILVTIPPLRERKADLPFLTQHFLKKFLDPGRSLKFSPESLRVMGAYHWPGNVRELEHLVERFSVMHPTDVVKAGDLPPYLLQSTEERPQSSSAELTFREARLDFERNYLQTILKVHNGNMAGAARAAQMDRAQFFRLVRRHDIDPRNP